MDSIDVSKLLLVAATSSSLLYSGVMMNSSKLAIPAMVKPGKVPSETASSAVLLHQLEAMSEYGWINYPTALISGAFHLISAYHFYDANNTTPTKLFLGGVALTAGCIPFTETVLSGVGKRIQALNKESANIPKGADDTRRRIDVVAAMQYWAKLNFIRAAMPAVGAMLAFAAV